MEQSSLSGIVSDRGDEPCNCIIYVSFTEGPDGIDPYSASLITADKDGLTTSASMGGHIEHGALPTISLIAVVDSSADIANVHIAYPTGSQNPGTVFHIHMACHDGSGDYETVQTFEVSWSDGESTIPSNPNSPIRFFNLDLVFPEYC